MEQKFTLYDMLFSFHSVSRVRMLSFPFGVRETQSLTLRNFADRKLLFDFISYFVHFCVLFEDFDSFHLDVIFRLSFLLVS